MPRKLQLPRHLEPKMKPVRGTLVLAVGDGRRELSLLRVGLRRHLLVLRVKGAVQWSTGPAGVPATRAQALDLALDRSEQLGLLAPPLRARARARAELARTESVW